MLGLLFAINLTAVGIFLMDIFIQVNFSKKIKIIKKIILLNLFDFNLGGAWRLHMLRKRLGDKIFWGAVQDYIATYSKKTVETEDFRKILEKHSFLNLSKFFEQWFYSKGYPKLKISVNYNDKNNIAGKIYFFLILF